MLQVFKRILPKPVKKVLIAVKQKTYDQWQKKRLFKRMQVKHAELLQQLKGKKKIKVVFLAIHKSVWKVDPVFKKMLHDSFFEPLILVCPYTSYGEERMWKDMEEAYEYFEGKGYPVLSSYNKEQERWLTLDEIRPDIVFFTNPHNLTRKEYYKDAYLNYLSCYVPYFFMATKHDGDESIQLSRVFFTSLWKIFWAHDHTGEQYKKVSVCKGRNSCVTGYPAVESLLIRECSTKPNPWKEQITQKKKIIFSPHHTIENDINSLSTFIFLGESVKALASANKDKVQWSFKPHPILKSKLYEHPDWGVDRTNEYYNFWKESDFTQLDEGEYDSLFKTSDAIIHDCSSFIIEYAFTGKPCLYLVNHNNLKGLLNEFGEGVMQTYQQARSQQEVKYFVESVINESTDSDIINRSYFNIYLEKYYKDKLPSERIIEDIKKSLGALSVH